MRTINHTGTLGGGAGGTLSKHTHILDMRLGGHGPVGVGVDGTRDSLTVRRNCEVGASQENKQSPGGRPLFLNKSVEAVDCPPRQTSGDWVFA